MKTFILMHNFVVCDITHKQIRITNKILWFLLFLLAIPALASQPRDGTFWQDLDFVQQQAWAIGWMDGAVTQVVPSTFNAEYVDRVNKTLGLNSDELVAGMNQFYAADYRNLAILMNEAAAFVERFAHGMDTAEAKSMLAALREKHHH